MRLVAEAGARRVLVGAQAKEVVPLGRVSEIPGLPRPALGVVLLQGRATLVIAIDPGAEPKVGVVCEVAGDTVVFAATRVGTDREIVPTEELDTDRIVALLENDVWAQRAHRMKILET